MPQLKYTDDRGKDRDQQKYHEKDAETGCHIQEIVTRFFIDVQFGMFRIVHEIPSLVFGISIPRMGAFCKEKYLEHCKEIFRVAALALTGGAHVRYDEM